MTSTSLIVVAGIYLLYATFSRRLERTPLTAPIVFVGAGLLVGSRGLGWIDLQLEEEVVSVLAEATLVVVLFADALRIDLRTLRRHLSIPARLLGIGLPLTIVLGTAFAPLLLPDISWAEATVLAVVLAPTDAALGQAVVTDSRVPARIRQALNVESGLNDGLCVPLLAIALAFAVSEIDTSGSGSEHPVVLLAEAIGWGVVGGVVAGFVAAYALTTATAHRWIEGSWRQIVPLAGAVGAFGIADSLGGSGFIAAFVGGVSFGIVAGRHADAAKFSEELGSVLNGLTLIVFGAVVLAAVWPRIGVREIGYAVLSLTVVRMIPVAVAMLGSGARLPTVLFLGWFGPRGLASIVFAVVVVEAAELPHTSQLVTVITTTVALSVVLHGVSAAPAARWYAAWHESQGAPMESTPTAEPRWRHAPRLTPAG